jgi:hypothetical protein
MTYREFVEHTKQSARMVRRTFTDPADDWMPIALVELPGGHVAVSPLPTELLDSDVGKDAMVNALCAVARQFKAHKLALVLSTWVSKVPNTPEARALADRGQFPGGMRPRDDPDREEALYVVVYDGERTELHHAPILRSRRRPPKLGEWAEPFVPGVDGADVGGRFGDGRITEALR